MQSRVVVQFGVGATLVVARGRKARPHQQTVPQSIRIPSSEISRVVL